MTVIDDVLRRSERLAALRSPWESHWQEVADLVLPRRADFTSSRTRGGKRTEKLFDGSAQQANELLAAALHGTLTNPASRWFTLRIEGEELNDSDEVQRWLNEVQRRMYAVFGSVDANFHPQLHELYLDIGAFGTSALYVGEEIGGGIQFRTRHLGEIFVAENAQGKIDTLFRKFRMNARQAIQVFGQKAVGDKLRRAFEKEPDREFELLHAVYPREERLEGKGDSRNLPFASVYAEVESRQLLKEGGFEEFPFMVPRWTKIAGEIYGRSPAMSVLPDIKMLQEMSKTVIKAAQKTVDPPLMVPDDGFLSPVRTVPGGLNFYRSGTQDRIEPLVTNARVDIGLELMENVRGRIRAGFFIDQLQLNEGPQMTATEVVQRTEERMRLMGPVLGRLQSELLGPLIDRVFAILLRRGELPEPPEMVQGMDVEIAYVSPIARAQRATDAESISRTIELLSPFIASDPSILDNVDGDKLLRHTADLFGVPAEVLRPKNEVHEIRETRAQAVEQETVKTDAERLAAGASKLKGLIEGGRNAL
jgi:hypothetical protein